MREELMLVKLKQRGEMEKTEMAGEEKEAGVDAEGREVEGEIDVADEPEPPRPEKMLSLRG